MQTGIEGGHECGQEGSLIGAREEDAACKRVITSWSARIPKEQIHKAQSEAFAGIVLEAVEERVAQARGYNVAKLCALVALETTEGCFALAPGAGFDGRENIDVALRL